MNTQPEKIKDGKIGIFTAHSNTLKNLNEKLITGFLSHRDDSDVKRTHLFNGRYENIYLNEKHIPELKVLREEASQLASSILGNTDIKAGYWFNYMPPGSITLPHSHDDDDELLSAAYYICVPEHSGDLIIHTDDEDVKITPEGGMFIFFSPDVSHEVTENLSQHERLSIGINFGKMAP